MPDSRSLGPVGTLDHLDDVAALETGHEVLEDVGLHVAERRLRAVLDPVGERLQRRGLLGEAVGSRSAAR
jgi:hypothetical protein